VIPKYQRSPETTITGGLRRDTANCRKQADVEIAPVCVGGQWNAAWSTSNCWQPQRLTYTRRAAQVPGFEADPNGEPEQARHRLFASLAGFFAALSTGSRPDFKPWSTDRKAVSR
jgi:hypothetical protein